MKTIKLVIIFVIILCIVAGVFLLVSGSGSGGLFGFRHTGNTYKELSEEIQTSWDGKSDWDENLYDKLWNKCRQIEKSKNINTDALIEMNTRIAIEKIKGKIFDEWKKSACSGCVVRAYIKAINFIEGKDSNAKNEPNVQFIKRVYGVYNNAYNFSHRDDIKYSPVYNGDSNSWNSFADYQRKIENERDAIRNNADYNQYLSNIEDLKTGLSTRIEGKLAIAKDRFYEMLAEEIIYFYKDRERDGSELDSLRKARSDYSTQYGNNNISKDFVGRLNDFVTTFNNEVEERERHDKELEI